MGQYWKILWPIIIIEHQAYYYHQTMHMHFCVQIGFSKVQIVVKSRQQLEKHMEPQICCVVNFMKVSTPIWFRNIWSCFKHDDLRNVFCLFADLYSLVLCVSRITASFVVLSPAEVRDSPENGDRHNHQTPLTGCTTCSIKTRHMPCWHYDIFISCNCIIHIIWWTGRNVMIGLWPILRENIA